MSAHGVCHRIGCCELASHRVVLVTRWGRREHIECAACSEERYAALSEPWCLSGSRTPLPQATAAARAAA